MIGLINCNVQMRTCCWPKNLKEKKRKKKSCSKSFSSHVARSICGCAKARRQAPTSAVALENSAWKLYLKKRGGTGTTHKQSKGWNESLSTLAFSRSLPAAFRAQSHLDVGSTYSVGTSAPETGAECRGPSGICAYRQAIVCRCLQRGAAGDRFKQPVFLES